MSKFRFHWGHGIAIFYSLFVIAILIIVIKSFSVDRSLVVDDYYYQDITYQKHKEKLSNAKSLMKDLEITYSKDDQTLKLVFPDQFNKLSGKILFYKPDNKKLDLEIEVEVDESNTQTISLDKMVGGVWTVKADWVGDSRSFYKEYNLYK
jgi:hypothetical protein